MITEDLYANDKSYAKCRQKQNSPSCEQFQFAYTPTQLGNKHVMKSSCKIDKLHFVVFCILKYDTGSTCVQTQSERWKQRALVKTGNIIGLSCLRDLYWPTHTHDGCKVTW